MNPDEVSAAQRQNVASLRAAAANLPVVAETEATKVARMIKTEASRRGHSIGIRIVRRSNGVRVTITGPHAARYRVALEKALEERVPSITAEIRVMLTRRA